MGIFRKNYLRRNPLRNESDTQQMLWMAFFIGQDIFVGIGKSATSNKFEIKSGYVQDERLELSNPHSS